MSVTNEQLAELLSGIAKAQQAIVEAVERANGGWRNNHLIPLLNIAANVRQPDPRLVDLPARILLRYQGRAAVDDAAIVADLERLFALPPGESQSVDASAATAPAAPRFAARPAAAPAAATPAAAAPAAPRPAAPAAPAGGELDFSKP